MPRDNRCVYMAHISFYVGCSESVGVCGNVCCVEAVVQDGIFSALECCMLQDATIWKRYTPHARTITVALDMSKAFDTIIIIFI